MPRAPGCGAPIRIGAPEYGPASDLAAPFKPSIYHTARQESDTPTEEDITMFRFMQRFGRDSQARWRSPGPMTRVRRRNHRLDCEALEGRQLLSGYYIVNEASGKVLDNSLSTINGTVIDQWQLYGGTNQQWNLVPQANGTVEIQNAQSGLALTATSGSEGT